MADESVPPTTRDGATLRQPRVWLAAVGMFAVAFGAAYCLNSSGGTGRTETGRRSAENAQEKSLDAKASPGVMERHLGQENAATAHSPLSADAIFAQVSPAVVQVIVQDQQGRAVSTGSGFLVSKNGLVATNYHVISEAHQAHVVLADKTSLPVEGAAALDKDADIAILKVAGQISVQPLKLAGNGLPPVGTKVYAIGNPCGLANTLSDGLVSGHQEIPVYKMTMIQTTAPISPGSSGGPLLAADKKVVGVTTISRIDGQNLNFAVPVSHVVRLLQQCDNEARLIRFPLVRQLDAVSCTESGIVWVNKKDYDKAIKEFDHAIRLDPTYIKAYNCRGAAWARKKDNDKAIRDFDEAIRLDPNYAKSYSNRGLAWIGKQNYDKAFKDLDQAILLDPNLAIAYSNRGLALLKKQDNESAIRDFDKAIRLDPTLAKAYSNRGVAWSKKNDSVKAIRDFDNAILLDPNYVPAYIERGVAWMNEQDYYKAIRDFDEAIRLDPNYAMAYYNRGTALSEQKDYSQAIREYSQAILLEPSFARAYNNRGVAWLNRQEYDKAIRDFDKAIQLDPNLSKAHANRNAALTRKQAQTR